MLKYPHDRIDGHVLLTDGNGAPFITDMSGATPLQYVRICIEFMRRLNVTLWGNSNDTRG